MTGGDGGGVVYREASFGEKDVYFANTGRMELMSTVFPELLGALIQSRSGLSPLRGAYRDCLTRYSGTSGGGLTCGVFMFP